MHITHIVLRNKAHSVFPSWIMLRSDFCDLLIHRVAVPLNFPPGFKSPESRKLRVWHIFFFFFNLLPVIGSDTYLCQIIFFSKIKWFKPDDWLQGHTRDVLHLYWTLSVTFTLRTLLPHRSRLAHSDWSENRVWNDGRFANSTSAVASITNFPKKNTLLTTCFCIKHCDVYELLLMFGGPVMIC